MTTEFLINNIKNVAEKHRNNKVFTFETRITDMCEDILPALEKLKEYEDAEEQGLLVKLPCKIGDVVYVPTRNYISKFTICSIELFNEGTFVNWRCESGMYPCMQYANIRGFVGSEIGKSVFLTKDMAEKVLDKMEGNDNNIRLVFKDTVTNLAGNRFGNEVFLEQVQGKIDEKNKNVVIFPEKIEDIASSFIEGFYKYLAEKYGREKALEIMKLQAEHQDCERKIKAKVEKC